MTTTEIFLWFQLENNHEDKFCIILTSISNIISSQMISNSEGLPSFQRLFVEILIINDCTSFTDYLYCSLWLVPLGVDVHLNFLSENLRHVN